MVAIGEVTPEQAERILKRVAKDLQKPTVLESAYADALVQEAISRAAARPTPQSRMAAEGLTASGAEIRPAGGSASEVFFGSEFGSDVYTQFQRNHDPQGYWFFPSADADSVLKTVDDELSEIVTDAIRGF